MAKNSSFVHLHNHTEFSMLDGMAKVDMLADEVVRQEMPAVGMTDHGNMYGSDAFYRRMTSAGVKPIIGATDTRGLMKYPSAASATWLLLIATT